MKIDILIAGAGGMGREVLHYVQDCNLDNETFNVLGFLDNNVDALKDFSTQVGIVAGASEFDFAPKAQIVIALGDPDARSKVRINAVQAGRKLASIVHPTSFVARSAKIGQGLVACPFTLVGVNASLGDNVLLNVYASVGHDTTIGRDTVLMPYAALTGNVRLGDQCAVGTHSTIAPGAHIDSFSKIAPSSVVSRSAPAGSLLVGNPAKGRVMFAIPELSE